jgi:hypothetical protein
MNHVKLSDYYKYKENLDGTVTFTSDEIKRFEENFRDILEIKYTTKHNPYAKDMYDRLSAYCRWFNTL